MTSKKFQWLTFQAVSIYVTIMILCSKLTIIYYAKHMSTFFHRVRNNPDSDVILQSMWYKEVFSTEDYMMEELTNTTLADDTTESHYSTQCTYACLHSVPDWCAHQLCLPVPGWPTQVTPLSNLAAFICMNDLRVNPRQNLPPCRYQ